MVCGNLYFWTSTIFRHNNLLLNDDFKDIILNQLQWLKNKNKIKVYGFVIMPNHIHLLWEMIEKNGKEMPNASFSKWTASCFLIQLRGKSIDSLTKYKVCESTRNYRFWERDALAVNMLSYSMAVQKLEYIHNNPLQEKWQLVKRPEDYKWSSAKFYETGVDDYNLVTHLSELM